MSSLYGLLATQDVVKKLPAAIAVWFVLILVLAFAIGFAKGFRKVAWGGFYWFFASIGFFVAYHFFGNKNPIASLLNGKHVGAASLIWTGILLIIAIAVSLIAYGCFGMLFRPKEVEAEEEEEVDQYGFVYEDEREEDSIYYKQPDILIKGGGKPKFFARLAGGFMSAVNVAAVLAVVTSLVVLIVSQTGLRNGILKYAFDSAITKSVLELSLNYAFDFFTIGIIMLIAYKGYNTGFLGSLRAIVTTLGILLIGDIAFTIPFMKASSSLYFVNKLIERCAALFGKFKPTYQMLFAKLTAGALLSVAGYVILGIVSFLLRKAMEKAEAHKTTLILDEVVAVAVYLVIGAMVATTLWAALYLLDYCGIFRVSEAFNNEIGLSKEFYRFAEHYLKDFADKYLLKFAA